MDIKKFERYEKVAEAGRVLSWLMRQGILEILESDIEEIAMEYAGLKKYTLYGVANKKTEIIESSENIAEIESRFWECTRHGGCVKVWIQESYSGKYINEWEAPATTVKGGHYCLICDDERGMGTQSMSDLEREFKEAVESGKYSSVKIQSQDSDEVIKEWVDEKVKKILGRTFTLKIKTRHNTIKEKVFKTYNEALPEYEEAIAIPYQNDKVWIEDNHSICMIVWEIENSRPNGRRESAQFTFDLCKEFGFLHLWNGKASAETVRYLLSEYACDYLNEDGSNPSAQQKWMRAVHITGVQGKDFWSRAKGLYEAYKKATANPVAK